MNRRTEGVTISRADDGLVKYKVVEGLSERTLESCRFHLSKFQSRVGDKPVAGVTTADVEDFLYCLLVDFRPERLCGKQQRLSSKTICSLFAGGARTIPYYHYHQLGGIMTARHGA
jgi:hypothetical protein